MNNKRRSRHKREHLCLALRTGSDAMLRKMAQQLGYFCKRGPGRASRSGSISGLIEAVAIGEVDLVRRSPGQRGSQEVEPRARGGT